MAFMYCDAPKAIIEMVSDRVPATHAYPYGFGVLSIQLEGGVQFEVANDDQGNSQERQFSQQLRKPDHVQVCYAPAPPSDEQGNAFLDRYAVVGDVESQRFAFVLTLRHRGAKKP